MQAMATTLPTLAKAFPPGDFIREELEERGWTQQELAERMGRPLQAVNMIVNGHKAITPETASQLEKVFGPSAIYWMNLESTWQLHKLAENQKTNKLAKRGVRSLPTRKPIPATSRRFTVKKPTMLSSFGGAGAKGSAPKIAALRDMQLSQKKANGNAASKNRKKNYK